MRRLSTAVSITDPLVKYQSLISTGVYSPDPAQHRLARHLRKIYLRIKDYSPQAEYRQRLDQVARIAQDNTAPEDNSEGILALRHHSIWRNPLFKHLRLSTTTEGRDSLALTRVLSSHETAIEIDSPKGLFLSGEVGTGKSMLLDLLAEGLPTKRKRRWHFNTFMLYTFSQLEGHRTLQGTSATSQVEYSVLWMAKKLVDESPILFLDEFQLPDRAASKLLSHLFIAFFQLGGVLVASSNRMPEELQNATGADYGAGPRQSLIRKIFGGGRDARGEMYGRGSDFANFLEVLKARCDFWQMDGTTDWRRIEEAECLGSSDQGPISQNKSAAGSGKEPEEEASSEMQKMPVNYFIWQNENHTIWQQHLNVTLSWNGPGAVLWEPSTLVVYGRKVHTPQHYRGCVLWDFEDLVGSFGPADYISMASSYHTFIIDHVPVLTVLQKNEARRFITLLDALYEARCKLVIRAQSPPSDLFFPEKRSVSKDDFRDPRDTSEDAIYSETMSEVYQDQVSPFRPNVSYYDTRSATSQYDPDQDSDFGLQKGKVDFGNTSAFTGEDERFAYKRAVSRLWELCSARWHARTGQWWHPLPPDARHWENHAVSTPLNGSDIRNPPQSSKERMGDSIVVDEVAGLSKWRIEQLRKQSDSENI